MKRDLKERQEALLHKNIDPPTNDRLYTVREVATMWRASESFVYRLFRDEPGVLRIGNVNSRKRTRIGLRIPQNVLDRVFAKQLVPEPKRKTA